MWQKNEVFVGCTPPLALFIGTANAKVCPESATEPQKRAEMLPFLAVSPQQGVWARHSRRYIGRCTIGRAASLPNRLGLRCTNHRSFEKESCEMCLLAVQYRLVPESPILVAANREEYFDRSSLAPSIQSGKPRVLCGIDQKAGGTWLGVNQNGLFVGLCNRATTMPLFGQRSRGLLALGPASLHVGQPGT